MKKNISITLNSNSIECLLEFIREYEEDMQTKTQLLVEKLLESGIKTANNYTTSSLVKFSMEVDPKKYGCKAVMVGADIHKIVRTWVVMQGAEGEQIKQAEVSPLLMAEFGSGWESENPQNIEGFGQGTFPEQTHAFDPNGWSWKTIDGEWHHSKGVKPTMPMYEAYLDMYSKIEKIGREVFGE